MAISRPRAHAAALLTGVLLAAGAWAGLFIAQFGRPTLSTRWAFELLQAKDAISRATPGRRVIIAGGSGALFGIRAAQLEHALGVPVINMATYAGLGLPYLLHRLQAQARPGDVIVLSLEYELYSREPDSVQVDYLSGRDPAYFRAMPVLDQVTGALRMDVGRALGPRLEERRASPPRNPLNVYEAPRHLDEVGDTLGNNAVLKNKALRDEVALLTPFEFSLGAKNERMLSEFSAWARAHEIRVLASHPNVIDFGGSWRAPKTVAAVRAIDDFHQRVGMPFLDEYVDTLYPRADFFDTAYHLDSVAARMRTDALVPRIASHLDRTTPWGMIETLAEPDHPLAELAKNFSGWEPMTGFGLVEGPYPQWKLGAVIWSNGTRSELVVRTDRASAARFAASIRGSAPGQRTELIVNGESVGSITFENDTDFRDWSAPVRLNAGDNHVELVHTGAKPQAALIKRMRFDAR